MRCWARLKGRAKACIACANISASMGSCAPSFTNPVGSIGARAALSLDWTVALVVVAEDGRAEDLAGADIQQVIPFWHVNRLFYHAGGVLNSCRLRQCPPSYTIYAGIEALFFLIILNLLLFKRLFTKNETLRLIIWLMHHPIYSPYLRLLR